MNRGEQLVQNIIADPDSGHTIELIEEMYRGYPVENVRRLLLNPDERVQSAGACVLSELGIQAGPLIDDAVPFLSHPNANVRHDAMECILVCATNKNGTAVVAVLPLLSDVHAYIRERTMWFLMNISDDALRAGKAVLNQESRNDEHTRGIDLLLSVSQLNPDELLSLLHSDNVVTKRYAVAAAARMGARGRDILSIAALNSTDKDIRSFAEHAPTTLTWRRRQ